jgi:hypothetical protein
VGQRHSAISRAQIRLVDPAGALQGRAQRLEARLRQRRRPIPPALRSPHAKLSRGDVHVLHAERERFEQPEPGSVQQARHEPGIALELRQQRAHLAAREHDGEMARVLRPHEPR